MRMSDWDLGRHEKVRRYGACSRSQTESGGSSKDELKGTRVSSTREDTGEVQGL